MNNISEEEYYRLKDEEIQEIISFYNLQEEWATNPMNILLMKQIDEIGMQIDSLISNWPEIDE